MPAVYPSGTAKYIPTGSALMFEGHYIPTGRVKVDRSSVRLVFAKGPVTCLALTTGIPEKDLRLPPGASGRFGLRTLSPPTPTCSA
jgi:hypothetical protein